MKGRYQEEKTIDLGPPLLPLPGSPLLGAGVPLSGLSKDQLGVTRSSTAPTLGAVEQPLAAPAPVADGDVVLSDSSQSDHIRSGRTWPAAARIKTAAPQPIMARPTSVVAITAQWNGAGTRRLAIGATRGSTIDASAMQQVENTKFPPA